MVLAECVGPQGRVERFDVQESALESTETKLRSRGLWERVTLHHGSHEAMAARVGMSGCRAVVFNLGYLPGGDKRCITRPETTLRGMAQALDLVEVGGVVTLTLYAGHPGGADEAEAVAQRVRSLPQAGFEVIHYGFVNQRNHPPEVYAVRRRE